MIEFDKNINEKPIQKFIILYDRALKASELNIEAACLSSISIEHKPRSRYINVKYVKNNNFIFFTNYESQKSQDIKHNNNICLNFFWKTINSQIRVEGNVQKISSIDSDKHWHSRNHDKNILAISSRQSQKSASYEEIIYKYNQIKQESSDFSRPQYWGGYSLKPIYFEFWEGHESRINKREVFDMVNGIWKHSFLQP